MGTAIFSRVRRKFSVKICEIDAGRREYLKKVFKIKPADLTPAIKESSVIILAVKPQDFDTVLEQIKPLVDNKKLIISIAAGITTHYIEKKLGGNIRVVRAMPNMPAQIGEGMTAVTKGKIASASDIKTAVAIFNAIGKTAFVDENFIDTVTAISGSGPAYVFLFAEYLMKAAQSLGLGEAVSRDLVYKTLTGSAHLLEKSQDNAATLRAKVTSKGGTTQAAMDVFMANNFEKTISEAVAAAKKRSEELKK